VGRYPSQIFTVPAPHLTSVADRCRPATRRKENTHELTYA
jgi:hypothetical protein